MSVDPIAFQDSSSTSHTSQAFQLGKCIFSLALPWKFSLCNMLTASLPRTLSKSKYLLKCLRISISRFSVAFECFLPRFLSSEASQAFPCPSSLATDVVVSRWLNFHGCLWHLCWFFLSLWSSHFTSTHFWQQPFSSKTQSKYSYLFPLCQQHFMTVATSQILY